LDIPENLNYGDLFIVDIRRSRNGRTSLLSVLRISGVLNLNIRAVNGWILCRRKPPETKIEGLMIHVSGSEFKNRELEVISVSHPRNRLTGAREEGHGPWVKPGDRVLSVIFDDIAGDPKGLDENLVFVDHENILMVLPEGCKTTSTYAPKKELGIGF
jgi:co-chaperonin GroES (HSP10)